MSRPGFRPSDRLASREPEHWVPLPAGAAESLPPLRLSTGAPWFFCLAFGVALLLAAGTAWHGALGWGAVVLQALFIAFFVRHVVFALVAVRSTPSDLTQPIVDTGFRPSVSVIVACRDEAAVVGRLVRSLHAIDYPRDRLQLVIVDDASTDGTGRRLDELANSYPELRVLHRKAGSGGGKAGALNAALDLATGEILVVFDADHRPHPDVARRLIRHFQDSTVAAVQGRCRVVNQSDTPLTQLIRLDYHAGYLVNEYGRQALYGLPADGGANCAVRRSALDAVGGWNEASVTEDTDLTMRLLLSGWRLRYDVTAVDDEEGVVTLRRYWRQRYRWARGHQQVWRDYRRAAWRSPWLSVMQKVETTMFLLSFHLPAFAGVGTVVLLLWLAGIAPPVEYVQAFALWTLLFLGPMVELGAGLAIARATRREVAQLAFFLPFFFLSVAICSKAWIDGIAGRPYSWVKTRRADDLTDGSAGLQGAMNR